MKLSDYKNEQALEVLADIIEPAAEILKDKNILKVFSGKKFDKMETVQILLKEHPTSIVKIMAALHRVPYGEYEFNMFTGTAQVLELLNDEELIRFFQSQGQIKSAETSGSATETTTETEKG